MNLIVSLKQSKILKTWSFNIDSINFTLIIQNKPEGEVKFHWRKMQILKETYSMDSHVLSIALQDWAHEI